MVNKAFYPTFYIIYGTIIYTQHAKIQIGIPIHEHVATTFLDILVKPQFS